jgi:hypothetical protein
MENAISVTSIIVIVAAPILRSLGLSFAFVENIVVRFLLIAALVFAIRTSKDALPGLLAFLAVFTLLLERNHEFLSKKTALPTFNTEMTLRNQKPVWPVIEYADPIQPPPLTPTDEVLQFEAPSKSNDDEITDPDLEFKGESTSVREFEKTDELVDNIPKLEQGPVSKNAMQFYASKNLL